MSTMRPYTKLPEDVSIPEDLIYLTPEILKLSRPYRPAISLSIEKLKEVIVLYKSGLSQAEMARRLGLSRSGVKVRLIRAMRTIANGKRLLKSEPPANPSIISVSLDASVDILPLRARAANCLENGNIKSLRELVSFSPSTLLKVKNFGLKSLEEIESALGEFGLGLREENERDEVIKKKAILSRKERAKRLLAAQESVHSSL